MRLTNASFREVHDHLLASASCHHHLHPPPFPLPTLSHHTLDTIIGLSPHQHNTTTTEVSLLKMYDYYSTVGVRLQRGGGCTKLGENSPEPDNVREVDNHLLASASRNPLSTLHRSHYQH